jgi:hypothetical protein
MHLFSALMIGLIAFNALVFVALYFFRRPRPKMRARLFNWVLHGNIGRRARSTDHSHHPA